MAGTNIYVAKEVICSFDINCMEINMPYKNPENLKKWRKKYYQEHREEIKKKSREWYYSNPEKAKTQRKKYNEKHREELIQYNRAYRKRVYPLLREKVLTHYGGDPPKCACCDEDHIEFLTIDHIGGGGNKARKTIHPHGGQAFHSWLIKNGFPDGYQVLCYNCNCSIGHYGYCPHRRPD